ncbi:unnamed protein product [Rotaria magnacalcarata]|uniref:Uncharacterized protein n=2 Tax=Rotaria magnacalcarata TaxID=392030 RepID=A0A816EZM6_9BILA|nr:unnamed protein product [Rotaria magnacalcarata]
MIINEETEQIMNTSPEHKINVDENKFITADLVSKSLKLINDDSLDSIHKPRIQQQQGNDLIHETLDDNTNAQLINSPARSIRRMHSDDLDDDFVKVTYKKKRNSNGGIHHKHQTTTAELHDQQPNSQIVNTNGHSNPYQRTIVNSSLRLAQQKQTTNPSIQQDISAAATRYAQTRYPFPPFIIRFSLGNINDKHVVEEIIKCAGNELDILLYVKDVDSFTNLLDQNKWPITLGNNKYTFPSTPSIPPQLSLIIKNVDLRTNLKEFIDYIKHQYPEVKNVIRLKNKMQQEIRFIKIELISAPVRNELLKKGRINVDYRTYEIEEYLAPVNVLICSKCCGIGHFKRQCTQNDITCKTCSHTFTDIKQHICTNMPKCVHCDGAHASNTASCPIVKQFRADLTKKLLFSNNTAAINNKSYNYDPNHFPSLIPPQNSSVVWSNSNILSKLNSLMQSINQINEKINKLSSWHENIEKLMEEKTKVMKFYDVILMVLKNINKITLPT